MFDCHSPFCVCILSVGFSDIAKILIDCLLRMPFVWFMKKTLAFIIFFVVMVASHVFAEVVLEPVNDPNLPVRFVMLVPNGEEPSESKASDAKNPESKKTDSQTVKKTSGKQAKSAAKKPGVWTDEDEDMLFTILNPDYHDYYFKAKGKSKLVRKEIFEANKKHLDLPLSLNILLGFGIGSYADGDPSGGLICTIGDVIGIGLTIAAYFISGKNFISIFNFENADSVISLVMTLAGGIALIASRVMGIIRPIALARAHSKELKKAIYYENAIKGLKSFVVLPSFNDNFSGVSGVAFVASVSL